MCKLVSRSFTVSLCFLLAIVASAQQAPQGNLEVEQITLDKYGFYPKRIEPASGRFRLRLRDLSGLPETDIRVFREAGPQLKERRSSRNAGRIWREVFELPPGRYVLTVAGHADWTCQIVIPNRGR